MRKVNDIGTYGEITLIEKLNMSNSLQSEKLHDIVDPDKTLNIGYVIGWAEMNCTGNDTDTKEEINYNNYVLKAVDKDTGEKKFYTTLSQTFMNAFTTIWDMLDESPEYSHDNIQIVVAKTKSDNGQYFLTCSAQEA